MFKLLKKYRRVKTRRPVENGSGDLSRNQLHVARTVHDSRRSASDIATWLQYVNGTRSVYEIKKKKSLPFSITLCLRCAGQRPVFCAVSEHPPQALATHVCAYRVSAFPFRRPYRRALLPVARRLAPRNSHAFPARPAHARAVKYTLAYISPVREIREQIVKRNELFSI